MGRMGDGLVVWWDVEATIKTPFGVAVSSRTLNHIGPEKCKDPEVTFCLIWGTLSQM